MSESLPPIKIDPRFGYYPRWPQDGDDWVHPEDAALARQLIPSTRIWRREADEGPFDTIHYGDHRLRVTAAMWQETPEPAFALGDWVEVRTSDHQHEPHTGQVREIEWDDHAHEIIYQLVERDQHLPNKYLATELHGVDPPTGIPEPTIEAPSPESLRDLEDLTEGLEIDEHRKRGGWG